MKKTELFKNTSFVIATPEPPDFDYSTSQIKLLNAENDVISYCDPGKSPHSQQGMEVINNSLRTPLHLQGTMMLAFLSSLCEEQLLQRAITRTCYGFLLLYVKLSKIQLKIRLTILVLKSLKSTM